MGLLPRAGTIARVRARFMSGSPEMRAAVRSRPRAIYWTRRAAVALLIAVLVAAGAAAAAAVDIVTSARAYDTTPTDAIAVLGASQYWGEPSPIFENRLDHARDLWAEGVAPVILTVGGKISGDIM